MEYTHSCVAYNIIYRHGKIKREGCELFKGFEVTGVFLNISKTFDKAWHWGFTFKLKENGISGYLLNLLYDSRRNIKQRVLLNG